MLWLLLLLVPLAGCLPRNATVQSAASASHAAVRAEIMELFLEDLLKSADGTASLSQPKAMRTSMAEIFASDKSQIDLPMTDTATAYSSSHFAIFVIYAMLICL